MADTQGKTPAKAESGRGSDIDRMFESFFGRPLGRGLLDWDWGPFRDAAVAAPVAAPRVDVHETDKAYTIEAELPGMEEKDINLELDKDVLTLKGEKKEERKEEKKNYHLTERRYGSFQRSFRLPENVDRDAIEADFRKGVLSITLPKSAKAEPSSRQIPVKG